MLNPTQCAAVAASLCLLALAGCNDEAGSSWAGTVTDSAGIQVVRNPLEPFQSPSWTVETVLEVSEVTAGEPGAFQSVADVTTDRSDNVLVLDGTALKVFNPLGRLVRTVGGTGEGPGEFAENGPFRVLIGPGDSIIIPDAFHGRAAVFDPTGTFARHFPMTRGDLWPRQWKQGLEGLPVARRLDGNDDRLLKLTSVGDSAHVAPIRLEYPKQFPTQENLNTLALANAPVWAPLSDGGWAVGESHEYRVTVIDSAGRISTVFSKDAPSNIVSAEQRRQYLDRWRTVFTEKMGERAWGMVSSLIEGPNEMPVITDLMEGPDQTLWVEQALPFDELRPEDGNLYNVDGHGSHRWDVFNREGRFLFTLELSSGFDLRRIQGRRLIGIQRDSLGVQSARILRLIDAASEGT